ncbi:MAG: hypothetical protein DMD69_16085 [Gemmatimonadetes bacterium]|nr:MAG: hypothetical protein DMD69_16085 [Gemmatimonadota bacterium]PYP27827.1 MAG: hypothetical protein DMD55_07350 [Gemmatimonadota bacterium]
MFGIEIPGWAIGVGVIILAGSLGGALKRLVSGDQGIPRPRGRVSRRDLGQTVGDLESRLGEVEALRSRLGELEDVQRRLGELEERVDFAERLLTKQRDGERLAPPQS